MRRSREERGFITIQYVVAAGLSLMLFVLVANLLVDLYERGAVRDALDEGVRAGVPAASGADACAARAREVVASVAGGAAVRVADVSCVLDGERVVATADVSLRSWLPVLLPEWHLRLRASAHRER